MCDLCDPPRRHWRGEPHKFADPEREFIFGGGSEWSREQIADLNRGSIENPPPPFVPNKIGSFDRKAYQKRYMREYMRERRATAKIQGSK